MPCLPADRRVRLRLCPGRDWFDCCGHPRSPQHDDGRHRSLPDGRELSSFQAVSAADPPRYPAGRRYLRCGRGKENHGAPEEKQAYVDEMVRKRGYVLDYHKVMAAHDFEVLQAANGLVSAAYLDERRLDRKTKELIFITTLTVMRASKGHIQSHIRVALDLGLTKEEILEAIEIALPEA